MFCKHEYYISRWVTVTYDWKFNIDTVFELLCVKCSKTKNKTFKNIEMNSDLARKVAEINNWRWDLTTPSR